MAKYDFFIAGRWRNKDNVKTVLDAVRASGKTAYCFIDNPYEGEKVEFRQNGNPEDFMKHAEEIDQNDPLVRKIFEADLSAQREAENFLVVLPAGNAAHIEMGIAYGLGKNCYAVGQLEKTETLYCIFEKVFPDIEALEKWLKTQ
jgi:hypothetical protein